MIEKFRIDIPGQIRLNIPGRLLLESSNSVAVRIGSADCDIAKLKEHYAHRLFNFEIEGDLIQDQALMKRLEKSRVKIGPNTGIFEVGKSLQFYKSFLPVFFIKPDSQLIKSINYLTAFGFQVHIDMANPPENSSILEKAVEFYLHNPLLKTPIEPFHSLVKTLSGRAKISLWDTEYEKLGSNAYIDDSENISLSRRWLDKGKSYGKIDNTWEDLTDSSLYVKLKNFKEELFRKKSPCIFCSHMDICAGFLKAIDGDWPCEPWIKAFDRLKGEVAKARSIMREIDEGAK